MAQNIADIREPIGVNDNPIVIAVVEEINVVELGKKKAETGNSTKVTNIKSTDLSENMVIAVSNGDNPKKQEEIGMEI